MEWLLAPIDASREHDVSAAIAWHGRLMLLAWGALIPLGIIAARYFKVMPGQDWPRELDNPRWWHSHLAFQYAGGALMLAGFALAAAGGSGAAAWPHRSLGYAVLALGALQFIAGWLRGTKGGPTEPSMRGDHYDMTPRRLVFERVHKSSGYLALALAVLAILSGLWAANAPRWMWIVITLWWIVLAAASFRWQRQGRFVSSYHAIWGSDEMHPGNRKGNRS